VKEPASKQASKKSERFVGLVGIRETRDVVCCVELETKQTGHEGTEDATDWTRKNRRRTKRRERCVPVGGQGSGSSNTTTCAGGEDVSMGSGKFALKGNYLSRQGGLRLRVESKVLSEPRRGACDGRPRGSRRRTGQA
jgi:hypothetical protein